MTDTAGLPDYDAIVDQYELHAEPATAAFGAHALRLAAVRAGEAALDIAAGTGAITIPLLALGAHVTAIDFSPPMVARLRARIAESDWAEHGEAHVMDGQALALADDSFDVALSMFGIMLFPDFRAGLREMARILRPGGRGVIGTWAGPTAPMQLYHEAIGDILGDRFPPAYPAGFAALGDDEGLARELSASGLRNCRIEPVTLPWTSPPREGMAAGAMRFFALIPPWPQLAEDERQAVTARIAAIAARDHRQPFESTALIALAEKP
jgi:SAM-dependent methyltransferase